MEVELIFSPGTTSTGGTKHPTYGKCFTFKGFCTGGQLRNFWNPEVSWYVMGVNVVGDSTVILLHGGTWLIHSLVKSLTVELELWTKCDVFLSCNDRWSRPVTTRKMNLLKK